MKMLTLLAVVLALSAFGQASADPQLTYYCIEFTPCDSNAETIHQLYSWFDTDLPEVGDILLVEYHNLVSLNLTCNAGYSQRYQHRAELLSSCASSSGTHQGWVFFESNRNGEKFSVVSVTLY